MSKLTLTSLRWVHGLGSAGAAQPFLAQQAYACGGNRPRRRPQESRRAKTRRHPVVQPLTMVDNSAFSPTHLTIPPGPAYPSFPELSMLCISSGEDSMTFHVFFFFLLFLLLLSLAWLGRLSLHHHGLPCSRAGAVHPVIHRLLKPRSPDDCPACRLASTPSSGAGPAPADVASLV
jgi:hypothetical protein